VASNLVDPLSLVTDWKDIGGLKETIEEIQETIIMPFQHQNLFADSGLIQPPKGLLFYVVGLHIVSEECYDLGVTMFNPV
jgi:SpoVK/Ycf46/Vps4 family AAA+-type ATPase